MSEINWNSLNNSRVFETLVSILLLHKDIELKTYLRLGPDAGIDIKSGDGKTVYQVKYITNQENFSSVISKAKKELQKIGKYKSDDHKNFQYWAGVKKWCLVTNALYNSSDEGKWKEQIEKPFQSIDLKAEFKDGLYLEKELLHFPSLKTEYFEGDNRVFLSLSEAIDSKKSDTIFSKGFNPKPIEGRSEELNKFSNFIKNDKKIILIHGPGGVGKTRFAIEAAMQANKKTNYDIFWANTSTMEKSTSWFQSIIHGRKTLLIIDEPTENRTIDILLEQIYSQKISDWKFAIITRSAKDHILKPLNPAKRGYIESPIELKPLDQETAKKITLSLITNSDKLNSFTVNSNKDKLVRFILKASGGIPIWIIVAIKLFEEKQNINDLPRDIYDLAKGYLEECLSSLLQDWPKNKLYQILKAIAILQPINIEDDSQLFSDYFKPLLENITKSELESIFKILQEKKLAGKRGRLLEIKPDVIRDYIIIKLIGENKEEAKEWLEKILRMKGTEKKKLALKQLARVAYYDKTQGEVKTFLDSTWDIFIEKAKNSSLRELKGIFDDQQYGIGVFSLAESISFSNLPKFIEFVQAIQLNENQKELIKYPWGEDSYLYLNNLILKLPWALYKAGGYAQSDEEVRQVFKELLNLAEKEQPLIKKYPFPYNDGSRAVRLIERLMPKGRYAYNMDIISDWIIKRLDRINNLNEDQIKVVNFLVIECFFKLEKSISEYIDSMVTLKQVIFKPESEFNKYRNKIFEKIWSVLNLSETNVKEKNKLWKMLEAYQSQLNDIIDRVNKEDKKIFNKELENNFNYIIDYLSNKHVDISEVDALRSIWSWHLKYGKKEIFKNLAKGCEKLLLEKDKTYPDLISLHAHNSFKAKEKQFKEYSKKLNSEDKIYSFIEDDFNYIGYKYRSVSRHIANNLVKCKILPDYISNYIKKIISNNKNDHHFRFVCELIFYQSAILRKNHKEILFNFLMDYWDQLPIIEMREYFLNIIYHPVPGLEFNVRKEDIQFVTRILYQSKKKFSKECFYKISYFAGNILFLDFNQSKKIIETIFQEVNLKNRSIVFKSYVEGAADRYFDHSNYKMAFSDQPPFKPKKDMFLWLIGQLNYIPSINFRSIHHGIGLEQIKEDLKGKFTVIDFVELLKKRLELLKEKDDSLWENIFLDNDFLKIVDPIRKEDQSCKNMQATLNELLDFNNHYESLLYYKLPDIVAQLDLEGFLIPSLIVERINNENFSWKKQKDTAPEYEWTRYAGHYPVNSKPWRAIAKIACDIAINKTRNEKEKYSIFSSLLDLKPQTFSSHPGVERTQSDFSNESDPNIKEFMKWRWEYAKRDLEEEKLANIEENRG